MKDSAPWGLRDQAAASLSVFIRGFNSPTPTGDMLQKQRARVASRRPSNVVPITVGSGI
jgi:hypothetical protein